MLDSTDLQTGLLHGGGLDRNIALELCRVTEAAALASARWMGRGDKNALDHAAVNAMRDHLQVVEMDGVIVIGEGEKDEAPMLFTGEQIADLTVVVLDRLRHARRR